MAIGMAREEGTTTKKVTCGKILRGMAIHYDGRPSQIEIGLQEWKDAAEALDNHLEFNAWKELDEDPYYDWRLVRKVRQALRGMREKNDVRGMIGILETCIRANFAGIESSRLYSETYFGTKTSIEGRPYSDCLCVHFSSRYSIHYRAREGNRMRPGLDRAIDGGETPFFQER
jgi:hypothetical protein